VAGSINAKTMRRNIQEKTAAEATANMVAMAKMAKLSAVIMSASRTTQVPMAVGTPIPIE
jgi:hypothetical protein